MELKPGSKLGPYEIVSLLGKGGMGEVWRAHDPQIGRDVAIKVSAQQFTDRFEREVRAIGALNHPNICTLYHVGPNYLVMELIEGSTLADRIAQGAVPLEEALGIAKQIADALEAAHEKNIVHRDLKPANVKIRPDGSVKVLDFGLAKAGEAQEVTADSPTMMPGTQVGMILGTAGYMSPEQARGKEVDKRADIWAFGVVLYEMVTGKRLFDGATVSDSLAAILREEPDLTLAPEKTRRLLRRCLEKDPKRRLRDIGDAMPLLEEGEPPTIVPLRSRLGDAGWIAAGVLATIAATVSFVHFREMPPADPVLHLSIPLPGNTPSGYLALSPDGKRLVIWHDNGGRGQLWLRSLDSPQAQLLSGTENARSAFWSPDSKSIGFFAEGKLKTILATGGPPQVLCDGTGTSAGGTWNRDGVILFSTSGPGDPLRRVNASGGACTTITRPDGDSRHAFPEFLPDGKHFIYVVTGGDEARQGLYIAALDHGAPRRLLADQSSAIFVPSTTGKKYGYLLFIRGSELVAQPFNSETLQFAGDVFPVAADASFTFSAPQILASASITGLLVYETNIQGTGYQLTWLDRSGKDLGKVGSAQDDGGVALSPDGKAAATVRRNQGIWLYDLQRGGETQLTSAGRRNGPVWSPEGNLIAFGAAEGIYLRDVKGGLKEELFLASRSRRVPSDWSSDGRYLIYTEIDSKGKDDIWYLPDPLDKSSERKPIKFQRTDATESQGQLSPDGRWLAYVSAESGPSEVYVRPFPSDSGRPGRWKVSVGHGASHQPRWRRDGKELFFLESALPVNRLMAATVQSGPPDGFRAGAPEALFEFRANYILPAANDFLYSPSADGQRFLVIAQAGDATPTLNVVSNWEKAALGGK